MNTEIYNVFALILQGTGVLVTVISVWLVMRQLNEMKKATQATTEATQATTKANQFTVMQRIAELMKSIDKTLYSLPEAILYCANEFPDNPPPRHDRWNITAGEADIIEQAKRKRDYFFEEHGGHEQFDESAKNAINALNDIAQYIEDGYANCADVLGQYHFKVLRIIHLVEAFRSHRDGDSDYGHRLLRLRQKAIQYHYMHLKHSDKPVSITLNTGGQLTIIELYKRVPQEENTESRRAMYKEAFEQSNA